MPVVSLYPNGTSAGVAGGTIEQNRRVRTECTGWSRGAARRNEEFLWSVDFTEQTGEAWALTLTLQAGYAGGRIPDSDEFHRMLRAMIERLRRLGAIRWHWVIEMTAAHTPHVHASIWLDKTRSSRDTGSGGAWSRCSSGFVPQVLDWCRIRCLRVGLVSD